MPVVLVEPPGSHLPLGHGLTALEGARLGAAVAAVVLAVLSRGDALVLAALLALAAWRPVPVVAVGAALAASSWRFGSTALEALSGAQAVLGPAGWVGPASSAAGSWLAAAAVVLAIPSSLRPGRGAPEADAENLLAWLAETDIAEVGGMEGSQRPLGAPNLRRAAATSEVGGTEGSQRPLGAPNLAAWTVWVLAVAAGATAAAIAAGPAPGGDLWVRVAATVAGVALALGVAALRGRAEPLDLGIDAVAALCGVGALVAVSLEAPGWAGTLDLPAVREGVALALAVGALVLVVDGARGTLADRRAATLASRP